MEKKPKIVVLSGKIKTGKSSSLLNWIKHKKVSGFLTPTIEGRKEFYDIEKEAYYPYQLEKKTSDSVIIGDFILNKNTFKLSNIIIKESSQKKFDWIIIDEIGKLELQNKGHNILFKKLLRNSNSNLLIVVRSNLLDEVIIKYNLNEINIIGIDDLRELY
ncbi:nucleoside-triphosphatase [Flavobacterium aquatile]|nr:nucleoside-triphosphatase [Flavobacterium aquatile]